MDWEKIDKSVNAEGETTITYEAAGTGRRLLIQSRRRKVPHSGRDGFWWVTKYAVIYYGADLIEKMSLKDAREYAEKFMEMKQ